MPPGTMLLADGAYELSHWMMKPFSHHRGRVSRAEWQRRRKFNKALSGARLIVESAFGALKGRFKCLKEHKYPASTATELSVACAVLHNLALFQRNDSMEDGELTWQDAVQRMRWRVSRVRPKPVPERFLRAPTPKAAREALVEYVCNYAGSRDQRPLSAEEWDSDDAASSCGSSAVSMDLDDE